MASSPRPVSTEDDDNPELGERWFAGARWGATGKLVDPIGYVRLTLGDLLEEMDGVEGKPKVKLDPALEKLREVLADLGGPVVDED